ncbi:MAG TPA: tRNA-dihydrouridine synthase [Candidatus Saccharimonadales bacterium]|nr:tRNA-dihydrouridine synthase [Candidatus Saccharimonadales bacterium]
MSYVTRSKSPFFVLAPMDDVTDTVFRQTVAGTAAPDLFFTEFTNVDGLQSVGRPKLLRKLRFVPGETSLVAHIWGLKPDNFYKTAQEIADGTFARELGLPEGCNFVGIDLNMGCPAKSEVKAGACSALINDRPLAREIIQATQDGAAGRLPVSVKTRLGFSAVDMTWAEFLLGQNLAMLTMHCRTRKEMSKVPAHYEYLSELVAMRDRRAPATLLVANGDVENRAHGLELAEKYGLDGIMIGRGIFHDPFAFASKTPWEDVGREERIDMYRRHVQLFADTWQAGERNIKTLNKFCKVYISDFDGAKELREQLMEANSTDELLQLLTKNA